MDGDDTSRAYTKAETELLARFILYAVCGIIAVISSALSLVVFCSTKQFRSRYILFIAFSAAELINGISFVIAGIYRSLYVKDNIYYANITNWDCIISTPYPVFFLIAGQLPALINLAMSVERVLALQMSVWYRTHFRNNFKNYMATSAVLFVSISCIVTIYWVNGHRRPLSDRLCSVMDFTDFTFGCVHYIGIAASYVISFVVLYLVFQRTKKVKASSVKNMRRQISLLAMTLVSVVLVAIPNFVLVANEIQKLDALSVGIAYSLYAIHSALDFPIYLYFREDFRKQFLEIFCGGKYSKKDSSLFRNVRASSSS